MNGTYGTSNALEKWGPRLVDEFLRRELRVGDPRNPKEVVTALRRRYTSDAARMDQESAGLPALYQTPSLLLPPATTAAGDTPGTKEERRVQADLESDLVALVDSRDNREWAPEIRGWRATLLREFSDGAAAARYGQDPAMRDRGFLAVRRLGEFARVARLVGVMNLTLNCDYRRLASTLDDACDVMRILMGEALYNAGLSDGGLIIQVPLVDLRQRRDSLVLAVRGLAGLLADDFDGDWGDDIAAYRSLLDELDRRNVPELKVYLREELLAPILDNLVSTVSRQDPEALRQLAATIPVEIGRLNRLREIASTLRLGPTLESGVASSLSKFEQALQLFIDGFAKARSGARLIDLALPLPMAAQQADEEDSDARRILREIVGLRGELAREVECFLSCCGCDVDELRCQVKLDKVMFDVDRAIDLFAQGQGRPPDWGTEERRASIYGIVARNMKNERGCITPAAAYDMISDVAQSGLTALTAARILGEALSSDAADPTENEEEEETLKDVREYAGAIETPIRVLIAAADELAAGRGPSEGILRDLEDSLPDLPDDLTSFEQASDQYTRLTRLAGAMEAPIAAEASQALALIIDLAELVAGKSDMDDVAGIGPSNAEDCGTGVGRTLTSFFGTVVTISGASPLFHAVAAIAAAQEALKASLVAIGDPDAANLKEAGTRASKARDKAAKAHAAAFPSSGTQPEALERRALLEAEDGARVAGDTAEEAAGLAQGEEGQPSVLFGVLKRIEETLTDSQSPFPRDPAELSALMREVFEDQLRGEQDWLDLIASLAPRCLGGGRRDLVLAARELLYGNPDFRRARRIAPIPVNAPPVPLRSAVTGVADAITREIAAAALTLKTAIESQGDDDEGGEGGGGGGTQKRPPRRAARGAKTKEIQGSTLRGRRDKVKDAGLLTRVPSAAVPPSSLPVAPVQPAAPRQEQASDLYKFVKALDQASANGSRGEIRRAIEMKLVRPEEWELLKSRSLQAGMPYNQGFVRLVDDLLDPTSAAPIDTTRVHDELQKVVYPFALGE